MHGIDEPYWKFIIMYTYIDERDPFEKTSKIPFHQDILASKITIKIFRLPCSLIFGLSAVKSGVIIFPNSG